MPEQRGALLRTCGVDVTDRQPHGISSAMLWSSALAAGGCVALSCLPAPAESRAEATPPEASLRSASLPWANTADQPPDGGYVDAGAPDGSAGEADLDPDNDGVVAPPEPLVDCEARLVAAGIRHTAAELPLHQGPGGALVCGSKQVIQYLGSASGIRFSPPPLLTCAMALGLARFERVVQEEAKVYLHARVKRIEQAGTYNCRKMARFSNMVSEHSYANAIDVRAITLDDGRTVSVLRDFGALGSTSDPLRAESRFLRSVARRAYDERVFSVVLTPYFDALHKDHLHLDMARYRVDGTR